MNFLKISKFRILLFSLIILAFSWHYLTILTTFSKVNSSNIKCELRTQNAMAGTVSKYSGYIGMVGSKKYKSTNDSIIGFASDLISEELVLNKAVREKNDDELRVLLDNLRTSRYWMNIYSSESKTLLTKTPKEQILLKDDLFKDLIRRASISGRSNVILSIDGKQSDVTANKIGRSGYYLIGFINENSISSNSLNQDLAEIVEKTSGNDIVVFDVDGNIKGATAGFLNSSGSSVKKQIFDMFNKTESELKHFRAYEANGSMVIDGYGVASRLDGNLIVTYKDMNDIMTEKVRIYLITFFVLLVNLAVTIFLVYKISNGQNSNDDDDAKKYSVYRAVIISTMIVMFMIFFNGIFSSELFKIDSINRMKVNIKNETIEFDKNIEISKEKIESYVDGNVVNSKFSTVFILNVLKDNIQQFENNYEIDDEAPTKARMYINNIGHDDEINIFSINRNQLLSDSRYKYIRDEISNKDSIQSFTSDVNLELDDTLSRQTSLFYSPKLDIIVVADRIVRNDFIDGSNIFDNLIKYSSKIDQVLSGNILIVDPDGTIEYDNKTSRVGKLFSYYDNENSISAMQMLQKNKYGYYEYSQTINGKCKRMISYSMYSRELGKYIVNINEYKEYSDENSKFRVNIIKWTMGSFVFSIVILLYIVTRNTLKLLD